MKREKLRKASSSPSETAAHPGVRRLDRAGDDLGKKREKVWVERERDE
jgi:hypothetical protein